MRSLTLPFFLSLFLSCAALAKEHLRLSDVLNPVPQVDPSIPSPLETMGLDVGERHWYHSEIIQYLDALAEVSTRMVALGEHAQSYGDRPLVSYAISSASNLEWLDDIKASRQQLVDPSSDLKLEQMPVVVHMMYSIHGNEPSTANATPLLAYYLTAALDSQLAQQLEKV